MKKLIVLLCLILCSCSFREDYYTLSVDGYKFTVGYDNVEYLRTTFSLDIKNELKENECIKDINVYSFGDYFCRIDVTNYSNKIISSDKAIISKLILYCNDVGERTFMIDDIELDDSITSNCEKFSGTKIERNGIACVLESTKSNRLNVIELHGDILASNQDKLDRIVMYVK